VSLNWWVFMWHLKVRMFSHSRMSAGSEFHVDGAATEKSVTIQFGVYARNDRQQSIGWTVMHGSVPARWDTSQWLWSASCESEEPLYRRPTASPEVNVCSAVVFCWVSSSRNVMYNLCLSVTGCSCGCSWYIVYAVRVSNGRECFV